MENHYEVNVALNGRHFFATAPRSIRHNEDLDIIVETFKEKFPEAEGYELSVTHWKASGTHIKI